MRTIGLFRCARLGSIAAVATLGGVALTPALAQANHETVTAVQGSAFGVFANVGLFGGPPSTRGPVPAVTLAADGSNSPQVASAPTGLVQYGPAILFTSGPLTVTTAGTLGATGSVTTTTSVGPVNTSGQEVFTAADVSSTCTASEAGVTGSTTIINGVLQTSEGDPNVEGDETFVMIPTNPGPNTSYDGTIESVGDRYRYVFNEQIVNPDGSLTVNAAHMYLLGPTAVGDLIIGQSVCGVTTVPTGPSDADGDGVPDASDNCPNTSNAGQVDTDGDGIGDACDPQDNTDTDGDGFRDAVDNCPNNANAGQVDTDGDGIGDACDPTPLPMPTTKEQCKNGGWKNYGVFKNQGDCVSFVASKQKNGPAR